MVDILSNDQISYVFRNHKQASTINVDNKPLKDWGGGHFDPTSGFSR